MNASDPRALVRLLRPALPMIVAGAVLQAAASAVSVVPYWAVLKLSTTLTSASPDDAWRYVTWFLGAVGVQAALSSIALLLTHVADVELQARLRRDLTDVLGRVPLAWFDAKGSARVRHCVQNDVDLIHHLVAHTVVDTVAAALTPLIGVIFCFWIDWRLGLAVLTPLVLYAALYSGLAPRDTRRTMERIDTALTGVSAAIVEYVNGIAVLKVFGRAGEGSAQFDAASRHFRSEFADAVRPHVRANAVALIALTGPFVALVCLGFGAWFTGRGWVEPGDVLVVTIVALLLPSALYTLGAAGQARNESVAAANRIVALLDEPTLPEPANPQAPRGNDVELEQVGFAYTPEHPAVRDVTFTVEPGTKVALVGPSGSGKSTVASLVARFRDVDSGAVRIGGVDVREMSPETLASTVGVVLQDVHLPSISIADNLRLGRADATDEELVEACRAARIHDRITRLPKGYDSVVGEDVRLSGGEAQRVTIARTLLARTPVLVLDEATSATDPESERDIQEALDELTRDRTVLVIAHRLSTVVDADRILVLDRGQIVERGTHDDLVRASGRYAQLWADHQEAPA